MAALYEQGVVHNVFSAAYSIDSILCHFYSCFQVFENNTTCLIHYNFPKTQILSENFNYFFMISFGNILCKETLEYYAPKCLKYCVAAEYFAIEDTMVNNDQGGWLLVAIIMKKALTDPFPQGTESVIN